MHTEAFPMPKGGDEIEREEELTPFEEEIKDPETQALFRAVRQSSEYATLSDEELLSVVKSSVEEEREKENRNA